MARANSGKKQAAKRVKGTRQQAAFAAPARYLFIDAWNVIHGLPRLSKRVAAGLDCARDALAQMVESIHQAEAIHVV